MSIAESSGGGRRATGRSDEKTLLKSEYASFRDEGSDGLCVSTGLGRIEREG